MTAYQAWSVVFGEQPSAAKWNILGSNDAAFNAGNGVTSLGLALSNALDGTNGVQTYTNTGSAGGTGYYINLGGIKICWGISTTLSTTATPSAKVVNMPTSFFSTVQAAMADVVNVASIANQQCNWSTIPDSTSGSVYIYTISGSGSLRFSWFVIGT